MAKPPEIDMKKDKKDKVNQNAKALLWSQAMQEMKPLSIGALAMMVSSYSNQAVPRLMGKLMDPASSKSENKTNSSLVSSILWLGVVGGSASFTRTVMLNRAKVNISARLRHDGFDTLMNKKEIEWFQSTGEKQTNGDGSNSVEGTDSLKGLTPAAIGVILKDDVDTVANTVTGTLPNLLRSTSSCAFGTYHMLSLNPGLVGISLAVAPVVGTVALLSRKSLKKVLALQQEAAMNSASFLEEKLNHILVVKMSNREQDEVEAFGKIQEEYVELGRRSALANGLSMGTMFSLGTTALCGILLAGGRSVEAKKMNHGQLVSFGTYSFMLALGTAGVVKALGDYSKGLQCAVRLCGLTNAKEEEEEKACHDEKASSILDVNRVEGIELKDASFVYESSPSTAVLKGVSLTLSRGEVVVVVGKNGAGKSTLASLLVGMLTPKSGKVLVHVKESNDDKPPKSVDISCELSSTDRAKLAQLVPQNPALFNTSVLENVRYSRPDATAEEVAKVMKASNSEGFVSKLKGGLDFNVGRNGERLSGGQKQRLGLARAILSDAACLVFDEPASSLDAEGECAVADAIQACRTSNRALLVVTHRVKTLELADRVVVLKDGSIVEEGSLAELQKKQGELCALMPDLI